MNERDLFVSAVQKSDSAERAAYLDQACAGDVALRQRVDVLLRAHEQAGGFLEQPAVAAVGTGGWTPPSEIEQSGLPAGQFFAEPPLVATAGTRIGPYKLLQLLGEGGMGAVWVAEQSEPVKRRVALKLIKPGMDSAQVIRRFEQERQALALMDHTNIAKVFDAGTTKGEPGGVSPGRPYFVMELVKGVPITKYCDELHLPIRERLELFVPVCQAIQHAHQKGIIHRDIKPSNVLVCMQDGKPVPKVIDFGVAKAVHQQLTDESMYTEIGQIVGTLEYMSPEQAELSALDIDTRADVYALGVLLYVLLTGTTPIDRKRLKQAALAEAMRIIREEEPPKPSTRLSDSKDSLPSLAAQRRTEPARLSKDMRGELDWIVMKCLEKDRTRRYETANGLARDVERHLHDEPVEAGPPSTSYKLKKLAHKHRRLLATAAAFLLLLIVGVVVSSWLAVWATQAEGLAQQRLKDVSAEQKKTEQALTAETKARQQTREALNSMTDEVIETLFAKQPQLGENEKAFLRKVLGFYEAFAAEKGETAEARSVAADGQFRVAKVRTFLGEKTEAAGGFLEAIRVQEKLSVDFPNVAAYRQDLANSYHNLGILMRQLGKGPEAATAHRQAIAIQEKLAADFPTVPAYRQELARSHNSLGILLNELGKRPEAEAEAAYRRALAIREILAADFPTLPAYRQDLAASHNNLGTVLGKRPEAETAYRQALVIEEKLAADFPNVPAYRQQLAASHHNLGTLLSDLGKRPEAETAYRRALVIEEKLAADFPNVPHYRELLAASQSDLGHLLRDLSKRPEAEAACRQALVIEEKLAADFPNVPHYRELLAASQSDLGNLLRDLGKHPEAETVYRQALVIQEKLAADFPTVPAYRQGLAVSHYNLGLVLSDLGKRPEAETAYRLAIAIQEKLAADFPNEPAYRQQLANSHYSLGVVLSDLGKRPEAEAAYRQALAIQEKLAADFPKQPAYRQGLARSHNNLGVVLSELGKRPEAEAAFRQALIIEEKLAADFPNVPAYRTDLAGSFVNFGNLLRKQERAQDSLEWYAKAIPLLEANLHQDARLITDRLFLRNAYWSRARALTDLKRFAEAIKDWDRAIELAEGPGQPRFRLQRALTLARAKDHAKAVTEADELTSDVKTPGEMLYNAACVYEVSIAVVPADSPLKELYASKALALLRRAQAAGYFKDAMVVDHLQKDDDLAALRDRADFKAFVAELVKQLPAKPQGGPAKPR